MKDNTLNKLGGFCSILLGVSYVLIGVLFLLLPPDQKPGSDPAAFYPSIAQSPTLDSIYNLVFALGAVLALGAVPAISEGVRSLHEGWVRWTTNLAFLGFAVTAIDFFRVWAFQPSRAVAFVAGDASTRAAIQATPQGLDPQGWLGFGGVGAWVLVVSLLALRGSTWPKPLAYLGIAVAILYWLVVVSLVFNIGLLLSIVAGLGGVILAPIWYIWVGLRLQQAS